MRNINTRPDMNLFIQNKLAIRQQSTSVAVDESYIKKFMKAVGWMDQSRTVSIGLDQYSLIVTLGDYAKLWLAGVVLIDVLR